MKKYLLVSLFVTSAVMLSGCGSENKPSMNYEQPVKTLALTMEGYDERGYLDCFTTPAAEEFVSSNSYNEDFVRYLYPESSNSQKLSVSILSHEELDERAVGELEQQYRKQFRRRIDITKAVKMSVRFKLYQKDVKRTDIKDITVVRVENAWYIYGGVINDFNFTSDDDATLSKTISDALDGVAGSKQ